MTTIDHLGYFIFFFQIREEPTTKHPTQSAQDVNSTYIRRSEGVLDVFWTSYVRSIYVLCRRDKENSLNFEENLWFFN